MFCGIVSNRHVGIASLVMVRNIATVAIEHRDNCSYYKLMYSNE